MLDHNPTVHLEAGAGAPAPVADGPDDVTVPARSGFGPPVRGSRIEVITATLAVPVAVDDGVTVVDEVAVVDEVVVEHDAVVEQPLMEQPVPEEPVEDEPVADAPSADEPVVESSPESDRTTIGDDGARDDDVAGQAGDDFWTGAASEDSVPTRRVIYGARSERDESWRRSWVRSVRRRRR